MKRRWTIGILIIALLAVYITMRMIAYHQILLTSNYVVDQLKQSISIVEELATREHYVPSNSENFYSPKDTESVVRLFNDNVLESLNSSYTSPIVKLYQVSMFNNGQELTAEVNIQFQVILGIKERVHIILKTNSPEFAHPTGTKLVSGAKLNTKWEVQMIHNNHAIG